MVNTLSHLGVGLLIASAAGLSSRQVKVVALMAILPDLDFILNFMLLAIDQGLSHQAYNILYYLMGHREFMHSVIFVSLVTLYVWYREKSPNLMLASGAAIFSHIYLDYITSWKMRPFFPFVKDASTIGAIDFFDPLVTIISFVPLFYILMEHAGKSRIKKNNEKYSDNDNAKKNKFMIIDVLKSKGKLNGMLQNSNDWFSGTSSGKHRALYSGLLIVLIIWCLVNPIAKAVLISNIEENEGYSIDYQSSYPISPGSFLSAYPYNDTYYRIFTFSYWSGIEKEALIPIYPDDAGEFTEYMLRSGTLYEGSLPGEIDYPVYNVSSSRDNVTVVLSDARNPFAQYWAYFKIEYVFVFDTDSENYNVYIKRGSQDGNEVPLNRFE